MKSWGDEELKLFIQLYPKESLIKLTKIFGRSRHALITKAYNLNLKKAIKEDGSIPYTNDDIEYIKTFYSILSLKEISIHLKRPIGSIKTVASRLKLKGIYWWTEDEITFLKNNFYFLSPEEISNKLNRNWRAITTKARKLGLKRKNRKGILRSRPKLFTEEEINYILNNCNIMSSTQISEKLNRYQSVIDNFCKKNNILLFKLRKNPENYSNDDLLVLLKNYAIELGRCPTTDEVQENKNFPSVDIYYDRFKSFSNACELCNLIPNKGLMGTICYSKNKDRCYSIQEQIITNFLIDNSIKYIKEFEYFNVINNLDSGIIMDWYIDNSFVTEYFGITNSEIYNLKTKYKINLCKENNISIIDIYPEDINRLNVIFNSLLSKNP